MVEKLRKSVRPIVTLAFAITIVGLATYETLVKGAVPDWFIGIAGGVVGYWFGGRKSGN